MDIYTVDSFTRQYVETALWSSTNEAGDPLDQDFSSEDVSPETLAKMAEDCRKFQEIAGDLISDESLLRTSDNDTYGSYGHDFWLTRNGHGAGFWDGDYAEPAASELTKLSKSFGEFALYVGDDGTINA